MDVSHGGVFNVRHGKRVAQTLTVPAQHKGALGRSVDLGRLLLAREGSFKFAALSSSGRNRQEQQTNKKYEHAGQPKCFKTITHRRFSFYDQYLARQPQRTSNGLEYLQLMVHSQNAIPVENRWTFHGSLLFAHLALLRRCFHADACLPLCRNASSSLLIWSFKLEHMPWDAPGMTLSVAPFTSFADKSDESAIGTIWSSSPWRTRVGTSNFLRSSVKSVSENALTQS